MSDPDHKVDWKLIKDVMNDVRASTIVEIGDWLIANGFTTTDVGLEGRLQDASPRQLTRLWHHIRDHEWRRLAAEGKL